MCARFNSRHKQGETAIVNVPGITKPEHCRIILRTAIQYILFDKKIIPYPYCVLNDVVNRSLNESEMSSRQIMFENLHKKKASAMITKVDDIFKGLDMEFKSGVNTQIREVAFLIGPTIHCPKEVYLFAVPDLYSDKNLKIPFKCDVMRHIFLNEEFMKFTSKTIQRTNMYVLIKKEKGDKSSWIHPLPNYNIPQRTPRVLIRLCGFCPRSIDVQMNSVVKQINDIKILELKRESSVSQQNNPMNSGTGNGEDKDVLNSLNEINFSLSKYSECNPEHSVFSNSSDSKDNENTQKLTQDTILNGKTLDRISNEDDVHVISHAIVKAVEDSKVSGKERVKEIEEEKATSLNDDLIWYIASEYLPFFSQPKVNSRLPNKGVKH